MKDWSDKSWLRDRPPRIVPWWYDWIVVAILLAMAFRLGWTNPD